MKTLLHYLSRSYSRILCLYPRSFRDEFTDEMKIVFEDSVNEAVRNGIIPLLVVCLRELGNLPASIVREFWHEFERKGANMVTNGKVNPVSSIGEGAGVWDALLGVLPFLLFGVASILVRTDFLFPYPYYYLNYAYSDLVLYVIALIGLLFGLTKGVPRWTYSYLGWSMFFAWSWMGVSVDSFRYPPFEHDQPFGWWSWLPILIVIGLVLFLTRSLRPLRQLVHDVWQDWTRLSLAMYAFIGFLAFVAGYDENHHPYIFAFMTASILAISASVWVFMRSRKAGKQSLALLSGCVAAYVIARISDATWELGPWYLEVYGAISIIAFLSLIMFWPVLIGFVRVSINNSEDAIAE